jgi:hypothetical protein
MKLTRRKFVQRLAIGSTLLSGGVGSKVVANFVQRSSGAQRPWGTKDDYPTLLISFGYRNLDIFYYQYYVRASLRQTVSLADAPYISIPEPTLLKQAQAKHDRVIQLLQSATRRTRK